MPGLSFLVEQRVEPIQIPNPEGLDFKSDPSASGTREGKGWIPNPSKPARLNIGKIFCRCGREVYKTFVELLTLVQLLHRKGSGNRRKIALVAPKSSGWRCCPGARQAAG